jgi:glycosyltransferase involved in cell wall biosynthesis
MPRFSVIIPTFNRRAMCQAAIESVLSQECKDFEIIVVDDGSNDGTDAALQAFGTQIQYLRQENQGPAIARNAGIWAAKGDYVAFLDSDDRWFPWTLSALRQAIERGTSGTDEPSVMAGRSIVYWNEFPTVDASALAVKCERFVDALEFYEKQQPPVILETGVLTIKRAALLGCGGFIQTRDNSEDIDLLLRVGTASGFIRLESPPLLAKHAHGTNIGLQLVASARGLHQIFASERAGRYPGGAGRQHGRLEIICVSARQTILEAAQRRQIGHAIDLYLRTLPWNLRIGRWKFVAGLPIKALAALLRRRPE